MEAKDLMIGCLYRVKKDVCLPKGTIVVIRGIDADNRFPERHLIGSATCLPVNSEDGFTYGVWVEYLEPIPITPEILEKNGFVNVENTQTSTIMYFFRDSLFRIEVYDFNHITIDSYYTDSSCDIFISSIHELQQALRLCGIKKEIIL